MISIYQEWDFFKRLLDMLEQQLGSNTEILLHDLTKDYNHTIVDIRNGYITNRKVGDCGSDLGLRVLSGEVKDGDMYRYITRTKDDRILKSSTVFIKGDDGTTIGAVCINEDITESIAMEKQLHERNGYSLYGEINQITNGEHGEVFVNNVNELLDHLLQQALQKVDKPLNKLEKEDKCRILEYLDQKGAFVISKAGEKVADFLGISKYTFYSYLDQVRENKSE